MIESVSDEVNDFILRLPAEQRPLIGKLIFAIQRVHPWYEIKLAWGGIAAKVGKNYSCLIESYKTHIKLKIWQGVKLKDLTGRLEGDGTNMKHIKYFSEAEVDDEHLTGLLTQQLELFEKGITYEPNRVKPKRRVKK